MKSKASIVRENLHLPLHEIKKEVKKVYPEVTNDNIENMISDIYKLNPGIVKYTQRKEKDISDDYER